MELVEHGYEDLVVVISPDVPEQQAGPVIGTTRGIHQVGNLILEKVEQFLACTFFFLQCLQNNFISLVPNFNLKIQKANSRPQCPRSL